jgi:hypothetical protein
MVRSSALHNNNNNNNNNILPEFFTNFHKQPQASEVVIEQTLNSDNRTDGARDPMEMKMLELC